ncbi:Succinyl-CoA ligase [ADP-forming] subunit beta, mitochondrial [Tetrabaena socialis]|uniref:Succinyl-CoA ligase [ADP-forming] subunit beta, mitochondrial n=1 Tax=Tetrabaena socialis TaxID=47790 RepID=A0A2J7ZID4_9CHLO|nr:Succinyl-CoA ligase [ADP-forming] subunit beta, mitochondrial [Tetrabaena socialis]|eukprot:PNH00033.1 Succinyl-CoA ligase [ADP-forming] subunit beta, mitochondrial [Tetrabaena socialis]
MLSSLRLLAKQGPGSLEALSQCQQLRFFNVHEYQGAQLMSKFGINVPPGIAAKSMEEVVKAVDEMADEQGEPVNTLLIAKKMKLAREMYFAILLDRKSSGPMMIGCSQGGTSIEDLAEKFPEKIIKIPVDSRVGVTDAQAALMVSGLGVAADKAAAAAVQIKALYDLFVKCDCTMVEVNPLAEGTEGQLIAADAKLGFDDNAAYRQKEIFAMKDESQIDPRMGRACLVSNGFFCLRNCFHCLSLTVYAPKITYMHAGGIMKCDVIASGIVNAAKQVGVAVPLIVRLEGTNVGRGKEILATSGVSIIAADDLDDAAKKAVASIAAK